MRKSNNTKTQNCVTRATSLRVPPTVSACFWLFLTLVQFFERVPRDMRKPRRSSCLTKGLVEKVLFTKQNSLKLRTSDSDRDYSTDAAYKSTFFAHAGGPLFFWFVRWLEQTFALTVGSLPSKLRCNKISTGRKIPGLIRNLWHNLENLPKPSPSKHGHVQQHIIFIKPANLFPHFIANKDYSKGCQLKKCEAPQLV